METPPPAPVPASPPVTAEVPLIYRPVSLLAISSVVAACVLSAENFTGNRDARDSRACAVIILFTLGRHGWQGREV